jgi:hypothetical protein
VIVGETRRIDMMTPMKGQSKATTHEQYIAELDEPRRSEIAAIDAFIRKHIPKSFDRHMRSGMMGYGTYHYKYATGREGDWFRIGLASNKNYISLYVCATVDGGYVAEKYKDKLPKASIGRSCVRFKKFDDLDAKIVAAMIKQASKSEFFGM